MTPPAAEAGRCTPAGAGAKATGTCAVEDHRSHPDTQTRSLRETSHCALDSQYFTIKWFFKIII